MKPGDDDHLYNECGARKRIDPSCYVMGFGKYEGMSLADIPDEWYMKFLTGLAEEKKDWFLAKCLSLK